MIKTQSQMDESIERFNLSFWGKKSGLRPPVGVVPHGVFNPSGYMKREINKSELIPADIGEDCCLSDYEYADSYKKFGCDDWIPFNAPWRAIPWIETICGCTARYSTGSLAPGERDENLVGLADINFPFSGIWAEKLKDITAGIAKTIPADCFASPTIMRGISDIIAAMRGLTNFYMDIIDGPESIKRITEKITDLYMEILDMHFHTVAPKNGGYGHIYGYWAPGKTNVIQEDVLGMCSPEVFREMFMEQDTRIIKHIGDYALFHLHSTGYAHYRDVLEMSGIAGLEFTIEMNGPPLRDMVNDIRHMLEKSRLILFIDHWFEDVPYIIENVPHEGLYLLISDKFVDNERSFRGFIENNFRRG